MQQVVWSVLQIRLTTAIVKTIARMIVTTVMVLAVMLLMMILMPASSSSADDEDDDNEGHESTGTDEKIAFTPGLLDDPILVTQSGKMRTVPQKSELKTEPKKPKKRGLNINTMSMDPH